MMKNYDYLYDFEDLTDSLSQLRMIDYSTGQTRSVWISVHDGDFVLQRCHSVPSHLADYIDLAVTVAAADRLSQRKTDRTCRIHVCLPVRHPNFLNQPDIIRQVQRVLYWYTQDHWSFEFVVRK